MTVPLGVIAPLEPADELIVYVLAVNVAEMVWLEVTFVKVYVLTAPTELPSTSTLEIVYPVLAAMVNVWLDPPLTEIAPDGDSEPPVPAVAVMV